MIVDGKKIASNLRAILADQVSRHQRPPVLAIIVVGSDPVIESFVRIKKRVADEIGVHIKEVRFSQHVSTEELVRGVELASGNPEVDGVVVQLPLPEHVTVQTVLNAIRIDKDVDMLSHEAMASFRSGVSKILPPVAAAVQEILEQYEVEVAGKEVLVLGYGRLVGKPVSILLRHNHAHVTVIDKPVSDLADHVRESHVVISGVGSPMLVTPNMVGEGVVLIDAGTSESGGKIVGDIDPTCASIAKLYTPVPGGVGPVAIAMLFKNLALLARDHREEM